MGKLNKLLISVKNSDIFAEVSSIKALDYEHKEILLSKELIFHNKDGVTLNILLANRLIEDSIADQTYQKLIGMVGKSTPARSKYEWEQGVLDHERIARDCYFFKDYKELEQLVFTDKNPQLVDVSLNYFLIPLCFIPFDLQRFLALPDAVQYYSFVIWFDLRRKKGLADGYALGLLESVCEHNPSNFVLKQLLAESYLYHLRLDDFNKVCSAEDKSCYGLQLNASYNFLQGNFDQSLELFEQAIIAKNKYSRRKNQYLGGQLGIFYKFCLLVLASQHSASLYSRVLEQLNFEFDNKKTTFEFTYLCRSIMAITSSLSSGENRELKSDRYRQLTFSDQLCVHQVLLIDLLGDVWCGRKLNKKKQKLITQCDNFFSCIGFALYANICTQLGTLDDSSDSRSGKELATTPATAPATAPATTYSKTMVNFPSLISPKAGWDIALERLIALNPKSASAAEPKKISNKPIRLIWEAEFGPNYVTFKAREQKQTSKNWSKGRPVALKRLVEETASFTYLTEADKKMCGAIVSYQGWGRYRSTEYELEGMNALVAAKDLDNVFLFGDLTAPIEFIQKEPELLIRQQGEELLLSIADLPQHLEADEKNETYSIKETSPERYTFTVFTPSHMEVAEIVGEGGLMIPLHAKNKVLESVSAIAPLLNIQSDIDELDTGLETVACDKHLVINIQPSHSGLEFTCLVMPFGDKGPAFKPSVGNASLTSELDGKRVATQRDLMQESVLLDLLDTHCSHFLAMKDNTLTIDDLQDALDALEKLEYVVNQDPSPLALRLRWPKGKKLRLTKPLEGQHLELSVGKKTEWFDLSGELVVDEDHVIELRKLLELVSGSNGRFVQLDSGQVLALSQDLRQRLEQLNHVTDQGKFHALASLHVAEATTGMRLKTLHAWEQQSTKMRESNEIEPAVPATLQADLRDYQQVGYDWMCRLAHWGAGACLADDMGLGKTLQALAILLARASNGPCLVIAPTSVCFNWQQEALKFAPTLNMKLFSDSTTTAQRDNLLSKVGAFDCVIISYGLLQRESELLAKVNWHTIVADEAQALKNPLAKRTQAACALKGDFKIITTGTPIENNLTELWSLFRFVNPGLLGSLKRFGQRYALPIENAKEDKLAARKASLGLKTLIQPFMLRRMKNQVLTELPSRTEINIHVELSQEEQAFYEALRLNAIDNISKSENTKNTGEQRIRMLAELVKLRQ
ncbi:MAG: hypothetical protein ACI93R_004233, partial [Flavobacteriales bacterium]